MPSPETGENKHKTPYQAVHMEKYPTDDNKTKVLENQPKHQQINIVEPKNQKLDPPTQNVKRSG